MNFLSLFFVWLDSGDGNIMLRRITIPPIKPAFSSCHTPILGVIRSLFTKEICFFISFLVHRCTYSLWLEYIAESVHLCVMCSSFAVSCIWLGLLIFFKGCLFFVAF